jgi:hypothetical protein
MEATKFKALLEKVKKKGFEKTFENACGDGGLGSCQYGGISDIIDICDEYDLTIPQLAAVLGATFTPGPKTPVAKVIAKFKKEEEKEIRSTAKAYKEDPKKDLAQLARVKTLNGAFNFARNQSWDLWAAASYFANLCFPKMKLKGMPKAPGFGPKWNVLAQNENYKTGFYCCLLMEEYKVNYDSFEGFDT